MKRLSVLAHCFVIIFSTNDMIIIIIKKIFFIVISYYSSIDQYLVARHQLLLGSICALDLLSVLVSWQRLEQHSECYKVTVHCVQPVSQKLCTKCRIVEL